MRCDKMHATISVKQCLANQKALVGIAGSPVKSLRYAGCNGCETGRLARKGELGDDDVLALFDLLKARANPPAENLPEPNRVEEPQNQIQEGAMEETKMCSRCKKPKPIGRFTRKSKDSEERRPHCMDCEIDYQRRHRMEKALAKKAAKGESGEKKSEPQNIEPRKEEKQAEPNPARETAAPTCPQNGFNPLDLEERVVAKILKNQLLLDFSCYPEVLKEIKRIAHHEERPAEVQARFMLKRLLQDGWGDEVGAAGGMRLIPLPHHDHMNAFLTSVNRNAKTVFPREDSDSGISSVRDLERRGSDG